MLNFFVFILCMGTALWNVHLENIQWVIIQTALALMNLPFAIKWLITFFEDV